MHNILNEDMLHFFFVVWQFIILQQRIYFFENDENY